MKSSMCYLLLRAMRSTFLFFFNIAYANFGFHMDLLMRALITPYTVFIKSALVEHVHRFPR